MSKEVDIFHGLDLKSSGSEMEIYLSDLAEAILRWLDRGQLEKLSFYLYRIDVNEHLASVILKKPISNKEKAIHLAKLMIERHLKKLKYRS